jgi:hypothetical protein
VILGLGDQPTSPASARLEQTRCSPVSRRDAPTAPMQLAKAAISATPRARIPRGQALPQFHFLGQRSGT